ncbi:hypothetical protein DRE_02586 [Drechslerella stenobrocha 248]|uniref:Sexual differentiation process protein isp4 n=1 Tax=Drechslerella stenobrocha 248 TaxID=1043628 RepID=W7I7D4_9PEZI|nr:hypothetical protein DRE_02586 [Drechslerella stenobrocha 248]
MLRNIRNSIGGRSTDATASGNDAIGPRESAERQAAQVYSTHEYDPNFPSEKLEDLGTAIANHDLEKEQAIVESTEENSPYLEVRAAVRNYDEEAPCNTIRAWCIGLFLATILSAINMFFSMRAPSITITSIVTQLIAYPIGRGWDLVMPKKKFKTFGREWSFVPGPFNQKEHVIAVVMANASFGGGAAYSTDILLAQISQYKFDYGWGFGLLLTISTQCLGFGLAGVCRRFLVWPAAMIWPANLVNTSLFYALHDHSKTDPVATNGWRISRYRFFLYILIGSFCWYWVPGWLFQALSVFAFPTFIAPNNVLVNQLFGGWTGVSLIPITFDWTQIAGYIGSPLVPPWHAIGNTVFGTVFFYVLVSIAVHYSGAWYSAYLPISDSHSYDNTAHQYNVSRILDENHRLDPAKYESYSPLFLSTTFAMSYGLSFAAIAAVIVHTALYHGKEIWYRMKSARTQEDDIHMKLMKKYKDSPDWWYLGFFVIMLAMGFTAALAWNTGLEWWAFIISIVIAAVWLVPVGMIQAVTNIQIGLNVITEFIIGYMTPGRPIAMMMFKTYGYITMSQALNFTQGLKLGHYMKVPPRTLFWAQVTAALWTSVVQVAVMYWALGSIKGICTKAAINHFTCPNATVFFNASIVWGVIGPARMFSPGQIYSGLMWFFLIGAVTPVIFYFLNRRFPKSFLRYVNWPVIFSGSGLIPPATPLNYLAWGIVGFVFNHHIRKRFAGWWSSYNYLTSAGLDVGLALCSILIVLTLSMTNAKEPNWWGNNVGKYTMDAEGTAIQKGVPDIGYFGPAEWH